MAPLRLLPRARVIALHHVEGGVPNIEQRDALWIDGRALLRQLASASQPLARLPHLPLVLLDECADEELVPRDVGVGLIATEEFAGIGQRLLGPDHVGACHLDDCEKERCPRSHFAACARLGSRLFELLTRKIELASTDMLPADGH